MTKYDSDFLNLEQVFIMEDEPESLFQDMVSIGKPFLMEDANAMYADHMVAQLPIFKPEVEPGFASSGLATSIAAPINTTILEKKPMSKNDNYSWTEPATTPSPPSSPETTVTSEVIRKVDPKKRKRSKPAADRPASTKKRKTATASTTRKKRRKRTPEMDEKRREEKRKRNRILAQQSRDRRKRYIQDLEQNNVTLTKKSEELTQENFRLRSAAKNQFVLALFLAMAWLVTSGSAPVRDSVVQQMKNMPMLVDDGQHPILVVSEQVQENLLQLEDDLESRISADMKDALLSTTSINKTMVANWLKDVPRKTAAKVWPNAVRPSGETTADDEPLTEQDVQQIMADSPFAQDSPLMISYLFLFMQAALGKDLPTPPEIPPSSQQPDHMTDDSDLGLTDSNPPSPQTHQASSPKIATSPKDHV